MTLADYSLEDLVLVEGPHVYVVGGSHELPSVTHLMRRVGLGFGGAAPQSALDRGRWVHDATTLIDEDDLDWISVPAEYEGYCRAWERVRREVPVEIVRSEWRSYHRAYGYAGTCDRIVQHDGVRQVLEIKTGDTTDWQVQAAAYAELDAHWRPGVPRAEIGLLVQLASDGTYRTAEASLADPWRTFVAVLQIADWLGRTGRADATMRNQHA